jgi:ABC-2 type transport system permease protein
MNIFYHECKVLGKSTFFWTLSLVLVAIVFLSLFPAFSKDAEATKRLLEGFPKEILKAMGLSLEIFFSILGYYSFVFVYIMLCGSIQAMNFGLSVLSKEVRDKTADFLLTKPIKRHQIMTAKLSAVVVSLLLTNLFYVLFAYITISLLTETALNNRVFLMISFSLLFVQLLFFALGVLVSVVVPKIKSVLTYSLAIVFGFFILDLFNEIIGEKAIRYLIPFKYFDSLYIMQNSSYETPFVMLALIVFVTFILASYIIYGKKDFLL